jgi:predicted aspartyl protease
MVRRIALVAFLMLAVAFAAASALAASPSATPAPRAGTPVLPSAEDIFARHQRAMGRLPSLVARWSGTVVDDGQTAKYEIVAARDGRFRRTYQLPLSGLTDGSNLVVDWTQDENGNVRSAPAERHEPMDSRLVRLNDLVFQTRGSSVSGVETIDGHKTYAVSIVVQGINVLVFFDVDSGLLDGADVGPETIRYRTYRRFEGVAVPTDIEETGPNESLTITVDNVDFIDEVKGQFDPPPQREPAFPAGSTQVTISFDSPHGLIVCPALVNGHAARFIIDSGSTTSIIDADAAKRFGLTTGGVSHVEGAALMTGTVARIDTLNLGGIVFAPLFVQAVPLQLPSRLQHLGIDGVLGYDVLNTLVARIAYARFQLQLIQSSAFSYKGNGAVLPIDLSRRVPIVQTTIGSNDSGTFTVDTGSSATLVLYPEYAGAHRNDFENPYNADTNFASGAGGDMPTRLYLITKLKLGQFDINDVPTEVLVREEGAFGQSSSDGLIGGGALSKFDAVFLDYANNRIILER